jgi:hypothetical protein
MNSEIHANGAADTDQPNLVAPLNTTPVDPKVHSRIPRGFDVLPTSSFKSGRFGRMFRNLPVFEHHSSDLSLLAGKMIDLAGTSPVENADIPAGYTYLGQFIDHDITFDPASSLQRQNDPDSLHNFRTPRFDLDSLYGSGPSDQPYLYEQSNGVTKFKLGENVGVVPDVASGEGPDLPRNEPRKAANGEDNFFARALIGDPRNDENLVISQLHLSMLQFHNNVTDVVVETTPFTGENLFKEAQRLVRWHYQWIVVNDFLPRIVGQDVVDDILRLESYPIGAGQTAGIIKPRFLFYRPEKAPYIPVEFSVAAYRFGHSMIRTGYHINDFVRGARNGDLIPIFGPEVPPDELENLNGFRRLPPQWAIEWKFFFEIPGADVQPLPSMAIDAHLVEPLALLPPGVASDPPPSLAERNLLRGLRLSLPSGTTVSRAMGIDPLTAADLDITDLSQDLQLHPPLWFYILKESEIREQGKRLGPVGARIVAEVFLGLLAGDPLSYLRVEPNFKPMTPIARDDGSFDMAQLLRFAKQPPA